MRGSFLFLRWRLAPLAATPASAQDDPSVHMVTYIEVAPAAQRQAATALRQLANASRKDAGLIRFEILQRTAPAREFVDPGKLERPASASTPMWRARITSNSARRSRRNLIAPIDDRFSLPTLIAPSQAGRAAAWSMSSPMSTCPGAVRDKVAGRADGAERTEPQGRRQPAFRRGAPEEPHQSFHRGRGLEGPARERRARAGRPYARVPRRARRRSPARCTISAGTGRCRRGATGRWSGAKRRTAGR